VAAAWTVSAAAVALALVLAVVPGIVEARFNRVTAQTARRPSARAEALHRRLTIVDLHADSLLWGRDLLERGGRGHVDVPRLLEGNVAVQGFTVVTKTPRRLNVQRNDDSDDVTRLAIASRWPVATWGSLRERALYQARRLRRMADQSGGRLVLVTDGAELERFLAARASGRPAVAGFLGLEGAQSLEGDLANLDVLADAGYRMIGLAHFFDTEWAGSAHGVRKGGLTPAGRDLVRRMEARGVLLDLAHASPAAIAEALGVARRPVVVSHTGVKGTCDNIRNLSDGELRGVAATGGVVGIGFWGGAADGAVCGTEPADIARAVRHAVEFAGADHVGLGSDWDGAVAVPFDASRVVELTDALLAAGLSEDVIARVMGGNALRVLGGMGVPR
jgi:microsomal dipeptidase-like Zn-dependent dipeptidase